MFFLNTGTTDDGRDLPLICDQGGVSTREDVERIKRACESHLENITDEDAERLNTERDARRKEEQLRFNRECASGRKRLPRPGFVYLMRDNRNGRTKIGVSKDPKYRELTLQSEQPDVVLIESWPGSFNDEQALHVHYAKYRVRGEWFDLPQAEVNTLRLKALEMKEVA